VNRYQKILITGAAGFIGSHLTRKLVQDGYQVGIIELADSQRWRIKDVLKKTTVYEIDLKDTKAILDSICHFEPDVIFHLATYYAVEHHQQEIPLMANTNVLGAHNLLEASVQASVKLFVNTSSCFVYMQKDKPLQEKDKLKPINLYALTKIQAEQACAFYSEAYDLRTITFRLFPPYGPGDHARRLIPYVIKNMIDGNSLKMTTGTQKWDMIFVDDIIAAYMRLLELPQLDSKYEVLNIGTGNTVSVKEIVSHIKKITGSSVEPEWDAIPHRSNEVWYVAANTRKTESLLGWKPKTQILDEGLDQTVKWFQQYWKEDKDAQ